MRYVTFRTTAGQIMPGVIEGDMVRRITSKTLSDFIAAHPEDRERAISSHALALSHVKLCPPLLHLRNIFCVGRNYLEHAKEGAKAAGRELKLPEVPTFFTKGPNSLAGPDSTLKLQSDVSKEYDYEAELGVVIGTRCKNISEDDAMSAVFGYVAVNDVTARDLQREHLQWFKGKSLDDCAPLGPWIVSADEIPDPHSLSIGLRVNGVTKQQSNTSNMIFRIPRLISELSRGMTLEPGDVIATGTPEGVGFARTPPEFLTDGDEMEVEIEKIGVLRNRVSIS
jgi:2-keto-4-pentenoate hydratase/2-oxohepta-3-ene-1,7-dioic acid hydratase in catechol pathway